MAQDDLRNGIALIFRRKAKDFLTDREFVFSASMDLRWFSYTDAMRFLELAVSSGLVRREGKAITPTFDFRKLELPAAFKPSADMLGERAGPQAGPERATLFLRLVDAVGKKTGEDRQTVIASTRSALSWMSTPRCWPSSPRGSRAWTFPGIWTRRKSSSGRESPRGPRNRSGTQRRRSSLIRPSPSPRFP